MSASVSRCQSGSWSQSATYAGFGSGMCCHGVGVDISAVQLKFAADRWPHLDLRRADALAFLNDTSYRFDAIYSVFGAVWFVDPELMLPAIRERLQGVLAFSYAEMNAVSSVPRWDLEPDEWALQLDKHGFTNIEMREIEPPAGKTPGTVLFRAESV
jgi:predicted TPR repeat methyltransferase